MAFEFRLPDIGEGVVEGEIVKWHVKPGQQVKEDDPLVEVMTDKATVMIPSPKKGTILETRGEEGKIVKVGAILLMIDTGDGIAPSSAPEAPAPEAARAAAKTQSEAAPSPAQGGRALATPAIRKMAQNMGVDINAVIGTGPGGRVTKEDLEARSASKTAAPSAPAATPQQPQPRPSGGVEELPFRGLRKKVAEKMVESRAHTVPYTYVEEIDMTEMVKLRNAARDIVSEQGIRLTYLPFIMKALIAGIRKYPQMNASLDEAKGKILVKHYYNLGVGVATPDGLTVVVVKNADQKTVYDIARELDRLSEAARANRVALEDLKDSTFTITSLGALGGIMATPVINYPEVAIVGIHKIEPRPVVRDGQIVIRDMMYLSLSFDHRVIDGAVGAEFCAYVKKFLENPALMFLQP